jgi:hypothetical protein
LTIPSAATDPMVVVVVVVVTAVVVGVGCVGVCVWGGVGVCVCGGVGVCVGVGGVGVVSALVST